MVSVTVSRNAQYKNVCTRTLEILQRTRIFKSSYSAKVSIANFVIKPEVYLRNTLHTCEEVCKQCILLSFGTKDRHHQKSRTVTPQKGMMSSII